MKIISIQEACERKIKRQRSVRGLELHAAGHCAHIGRISPGCITCFVPGRAGVNIPFGPKCNADCAYCPSDKKYKKPSKKKSNKLFHTIKINIFKRSIQRDYTPLAYSFTGGGEPLLYINRVCELMKFFRETERLTKKKPWYYLYTNGLSADNDTLLKLGRMGFDEIRFHLGASNFSDKVYRNMRAAVRHFKAVTVETPAWPPHRKKLFRMLPIIDDIGVKHLNIGEIELNIFNYGRISRILPHAEAYHCYELHLYDGGLVYDIMEEVLKRKYSYSVLDCNCFVKQLQRAPAKQTAHEDVSGLCASY